MILRQKTSPFPKRGTMKNRIFQLAILFLLLTPVLTSAGSSRLPPSEGQGDQGTLDLHMTWNGINVTGAPVYLYTENGTYLDRCATTDARGHVQFTVPNTPHNFRVEYRGKEYWTGALFAIADQKLDVEVRLEELAESTNNPNSTRYDGEPSTMNPCRWPASGPTSASFHRPLSLRYNSPKCTTSSPTTSAPP
jgi:hypothetical protein